jgi:hypothetical protein
MTKPPLTYCPRLDELDRLAALQGFRPEYLRRIRKEDDEMLSGAWEGIERSRVLPSRIEARSPLSPVIGKRHG